MKYSVPTYIHIDYDKWIFNMKNQGEQVINVQKIYVIPQALQEFSLINQEALMQSYDTTFSSYEVCDDHLYHGRIIKFIHLY